MSQQLGSEVERQGKSNKVNYTYTHVHTFLIGRKLKTSQYDWPTVEEEDGDEQAQGEMDMFR